MKAEIKNTFPKTPTGIIGLDEITNGGFPKGRPVLICGSAGSGKTLFATQFLVKGITDYNEPGVFMSFEESVYDLTQNVISLGFDLEKFKAENMLRVDHVHIERSEIEETGEYDLEGLFVRLNYAIDSIGAKRVVLDTLESLFAGVKDMAILRSELRRLFLWLKEKGVTAIITGEKGEYTLTRHGLEEYVTDCVVFLDLRVIDQIATRRLRIIKYRGSTHGTNEYPFSIDEHGISMIQVSSLKLDYKSSNDVISTGLPALDKFFSTGGLYRGSSIFITGTAGTSKTTLASYFAMSSCLRNERVLFFSFEESPEQLIRNMGSVGIDLREQIKLNLLRIHASRPSFQGLEMHLLLMYNLMMEFKPKTVIIDPISSLLTIGTGSEVHGMLIRLMDKLKTNQISTLFTCLSQLNGISDSSIEAVSSLADTWITVENEIIENQRIRSLLIIKSRGMGNVNNQQNFIITDNGIQFQHNTEALKHSN